MDIKVIGVNEVRKGDTILTEDNAICKVTEVTFSAPGKHGHAKARIEAVGLLDDKKRVFVLPSENKLKVPIIDKRDAQVVSIDGDKVQLMDAETYDLFEAEIPEEFKERIKEGVQVVYSDLMGKKVIKNIK